MVQVEFNKKSTNQFYGMRNTLDIYQNASKGMSVSKSVLESAWQEAKTTEQKAVLFSVLFFVGDVVGRQHNIFDGKIDGGGNSQREVFRDNIIPFMAGKVKTLPKVSRLALMGLITEYTTLDNIVAIRVKTKKKTARVVEVIDMVTIFNVDDVASYIANIIRRGTIFQKICVAKFVTRPRFSKRSKSTKMLDETKTVMATKAMLLHKVSKLAKLPVTVKQNYTDFEGFYTWRKDFNVNFESVLFSTKAILEFDKEQFLELINKMPSDARFRVRNRVMFNEKWVGLRAWFLEWEAYKAAKQSEQRQIETKIDNEGNTEVTKAKLAKVKKEAKVTTGAVGFPELFTQIINGSVDKIKVQPFLDKISLPYNSLVFVDGSASMGSQRGEGFSARQFAAFMAAIVLTKNPDADARDLVGLFSNTCRMFNGINSLNRSKNSLLRANTVSVNKRALINSEDHFLDNLNSFKSWLDTESTYRGTNLNSIPDNLHAYTQGDANKLEELQRYPIWTLISDGNFNNGPSTEASLNDFMRKCEMYFGFRPYLILIDVAGKSAASITRFSGIDNVMMVPPNPAAIEMLLTNFKDMDTFDVYTPLQSLFRTNRYAPIRNFVEKLSTKSVKSKLMVE